MTALTYDDIQLVPSLSNVKTRADISLKTLISRRYGILTPLIASPMDTICEKEMAFKMFLLGGVGCIHRFMTIEEQTNQIKWLHWKIYGEGFGGAYENWGVMLDDWHSEIKQIPIIGTTGVQDDEKYRINHIVTAGANVILIDVAHGHHQNVYDMIKWCKENLPESVDIIAGNIVTAEAAQYLEDAGVDGLRVGIGGGCFTPDMKVKTNKGLKKIKDIKIGNIVYTHTGEQHKVINKFSYEKNEDILIINDIECTKNHEFYVVNKKHINKIKNDNDIQNYAEWVSAENLTTDYLLIEL